MLVLGRRVGQSVSIGEGIKVRIVRLRGNRVGLGIIAPPEVSILRGELPASDEAEETSPPPDPGRPV
jgi:carbon storage regulator